MSANAVEILKAFERALFAGQDIRPFFAERATYEVIGSPPLGGRFAGREAIHASFEQRLTGLGPGMKGEDIAREIYGSADGSKAVAEIQERSWLPSAPEDVLEVRTCSVATVADGLITSLVDYTDSAAYEAFLARHRHELPKFAGQG